MSKKAVQRNYFTNQPYLMENQTKLQIEKRQRQFKSNEWLTFLQAKECAGYVKKGERGVQLQVAIFDENDPTKFIACKTFVVFNSDQCENLDADLKLNIEEAAIYRTLRHDGSELTRKQLARASKFLAS